MVKQRLCRCDEWGQYLLGLFARVYLAACGSTDIPDIPDIPEDPEIRLRQLTVNVRNSREGCEVYFSMSEALKRQAALLLNRKP